ncbi:hypothetical protein PM082_002224 [Marasmius tenuissimus]|nr:hypothetical protein PM082_002224 [Marasmius tenuissimus]
MEYPPLLIQPHAKFVMTASDIAAVLRSPGANQQIGEDSLAAISRFIRDAEKDLDMYDDYMHRISSRQAAIKRVISQLLSIKAPIRRLPLELLRRIFLFATSPESNLFRSFDSSYSSTCRLSSVCKHWREIALNFPQIWSEFTVSPETCYEDSLKMFLHRSKQYPLTLWIEGSTVSDEQLAPLQFPGHEKIIRLLIQHHHRWRDVDIMSHSWTQMEPLRNVDNLPILRSIVCQPYLCPHLNDTLRDQAHQNNGR